MYQGKHVKTRKHIKSPVVLLVSMILILATVATGTLAFLVAGSQSIENVFTPAEVENAIGETLSKTDQGDVLIKENVTVKNTGDVDAYIRAQIICTWVKDNEVYGLAPEEGRDYEVALGTDWVKHGDYYYWPAVVADDASTGVLIEKCTAKDMAPEGYQLSVEILSQSIQADGVNAEGVKAVAEAWGIDPTQLS